MTSANDLLFGSSNPSVSFKDAPIGTRFTFNITKVREPQQQQDFTTGNPATWQDGRPKMTVPVDVQLVGNYEKIDSDDSGARSWWIAVGTQLHKATREAVKRSGAKGIEAGATVAVTFTGTEASKMRGGNPKKLYSVDYTPPTGGSDAVMDAPANVSQGSVEAALANLTPEQKKALGLPDF